MMENLQQIKNQTNFCIKKIKLKLNKTIVKTHSKRKSKNQKPKPKNKLVNCK